MAILAWLAVGLAACAGGSSNSSGHITVQHILIAVKGGGQTTPFRVTKQPSRTPAEAEELANKLLAEATAGKDFDELASQNSDDTPPGTYTMSDYGVTAEPGEYPRSNVPLTFSNISFSLKVGDIAVAPYDPGNNPAGYEVIKRIR